MGWVAGGDEVVSLDMSRKMDYLHCFTAHWQTRLEELWRMAAMRKGRTYSCSLKRCIQL